MASLNIAELPVQIAAAIFDFAFERCAECGDAAFDEDISKCGCGRRCCKWCFEWAVSEIEARIWLYQ